MCDGIKDRICLKCQKLFESLHIGNRICERCNRQNVAICQRCVPITRGIQRKNGVDLCYDDGFYSYLNENN